MKKNIIHWSDFDTIRKLKASLIKENVSVVETDTVLGLISNITQGGFNKLNEIKKRSEKSYIILINSIEKLSLFTEINLNNRKLIKLLNNCWPGQVTIIFKCKKNISDCLKSSKNTIAIRIPNHFGLLQLLTYFDGLFSTSANISGQKIPDQIELLSSEIVDEIEYIVADEKKIYPLISSTIIDCTEDKIKVIRQGAYPIDKLEELYGETFEK